MYQNMLPSPALSPDLLPPSPISGWNPVVIAIVGLLGAIVIILFYGRRLKGQCSDEDSLRGNQAEVQRMSDATSYDSQLHSHGLDSTILSSLPAVQFRKKNEGVANQGETDCAVCLGEFKEEEWLRYLPNCTHAFHISCIDSWFQSHSDCPLCRTNVIYNLTNHQGQAVSMYSLAETPRNECTNRGERAGDHQVVPSGSTQSLTNAS